MPTKHRRHAITETPEVKAALDELRALTGEDAVPLRELVVLGAEVKAARLRDAGRQDRQAQLEELAELIRTGGLPQLDIEAADAVKRLRPDDVPPREADDAAA